MNNDIFSFYKVKETDKQALEKYWIYKKESFKHWKDTLVAIRRFESIEKYSLKQAEFFITACPARFLTIRLYTGDKKLFELSTGSGNISEYVRKIMPILELMGNDKLSIREIKL